MGTATLTWQTRAQVSILQVVSHIKTRLQALPSPELPLDALCHVLQQSQLSVFSHDLALLFIGASPVARSVSPCSDRASSCVPSERGFGAASPEQQAAVLAALAPRISSFSASQQAAFFRLLVRALPVSAAAIFPRSEALSGADVDEGDANVDVLLDFLLDLVLYEPPSSLATADAVVYGMLVPRVERLQRVKVSELKREALYERQLHALKLVKEVEIPTRQKIPIFLAGSASFHHAVKAFCEVQLSHVLKYEDKELENADAMRRVMALVLGSQVAQNSGSFEGADAVLLTNRARLADPSILQALALLSASETAANVLPIMLQLLCQHLFGAEPSRPPNVDNKIKLAAVRLCQWTFHHCQQTSLERLLGPVLLPTLLRLLMHLHTESEASSGEFVREFRQGIYESLSVLGKRVPTLMAASEQAFQVLLVRCLAEEEHRTGAGASALQAFTSLAVAYAVSATPAIRVKVQNELVALLNGSKLFDPTKNYARVRRAIAEWCAELLTSKAAEQDSIILRFAVLRLFSSDEDTRHLSDKALFAQPLPSTSALAQSLQAKFPHKDLKKSMVNAGAVESCMRFFVEIMKTSQGSIHPENVDDRRIIVEYIVHTFLNPTEDSAETAATAVVEVCRFDSKIVTTVLMDHMHELYKVAQASQDRNFLTNIATIVMCTCCAGMLTVSQVLSNFVENGTNKLHKGDSSGEVSGVLYILGAALCYIGSNVDLVNTMSEEEMRLLLSCFQQMVDLLERKVAEGSNFALYPRSELAQNAHVTLLRSTMDGVGFAGSLKSCLRSSVPAVSSEWNQLKSRTLDGFRHVVEWELKAAHFDEQLVPKLAFLRRIAVENIGRSVSGLPTGIPASLSNSLEETVKALLNLGDQIDAELQFAVGEALVTLGAHDAEEVFALERTAKYSVFSENRAAAIFERVLSEYAGSRQPKHRRNATIWLLCMCAAGLGSPSTKSYVLSSLKSWKCVLASPAYSQSLLEVHEFFVTMLNDANDVSKESAVKGLAYLRLHAPSDEMGLQFSESLFRRLRCFRAFTPAVDAANEDDENIGGGTTRADESRASSSSSTVDNAGYREVCNVAADVGDPELMYALLYLSTSDPVWESFTTFGSTTILDSDKFSFAAVDKLFYDAIASKAFEDYSGKAKLVPWLFLLKFHSNTTVASVMGKLWTFAKGESTSVGTAKGEKKSLRQSWALLFQFVLARLENARNFKYREAACRALLDLLNGAEPNDLRNDFLRLWKTASRAVDDVMEVVALSGMKLYRYLGEVSLRVAANDPVCRAQLLQFLIGDGIVSKNTICRTLSIDVLLLLVKTLKAEDMQESLAPLLLKLLEYLSSLEMPELQYAQFHVEKKPQLERLRVSISQSGPVGQLLELTTVRLNELAGSPSCVTVVAELVRGVANLLKFGVGLNTRVGTANFVVTLASTLPFELRKCNGAELLLRRVLIPFVSSKTAEENDKYGDEESRYGGNGSNSAEDTNDGSATSVLVDGLVLQSYCRAAAYLCPLVDAPTVCDYVRSGIFAFNAHDENALTEGSQVYTSRFLLISALATKELVMKVPPIANADTVVSNDLRNTWYCTHVFPAAFIGQFAATDALKSSWTVVLEELPPSVLYSSTSLNAALQSIALLLSHPAWDTRRQAARALQAIFASATYRSKLSTEQITRIWQELLDAVPGRLWKGKSVILESIVALATVKLEIDTTYSNQDWALKLSLLLADECGRAWQNNDLVYLESAIINLGRFSSLLPVEQNDLRASNVQSLRNAFAEWMDQNDAETLDSSKILPPLLIKCIFESLALMWPPLTTDRPAASAGYDQKVLETISWLCANVESPHLAAWSIRKAVFQALTAVVDRAPAEALIGGKQYAVERVVETCCGPFGVEDGKYSMVRVSAAGALVALLKRGTDNSSVGLILVVLRERMSAAVQTLLASEEASELQAAFHLKTQLLQMP
ncbi:unnamed protein product [Phytophthora fragariaefolia]|uniref:Unnamed protein product n=1 Tax=Phytophthora fragariaefolia TaxID=1490495 RepID=A0A9W7D4U1_9STRA|nr:unnamed protein product [Phytophthora fragariaefolia]